MKAIDSLRSRWAAGQGLGGDNATYASGGGSGGDTFLDDLSSTLLFSADLDCAASSSGGHVDLSARRAGMAFSEGAVLSACMLLALCGWMPMITTTTAVAATATTTTTSTGSTSVGTGTSGNESGTASFSSSVDGGGSDNVVVSFRCNICGRAFPMTCFMASPSSSSSSSSSSTAAHCDPLSQHRAFCLWARAESTTNHSHGAFVTDPGSSIQSMPGWLHCANAMTDIDATPSSSSASTTSFSFTGQGQRMQEGQSSSTSTLLGIDSHPRTTSPASTYTFAHHPTLQDNTSGMNSSIDAEQAYKKIKLVMDMATTTIKPNPNLTQPY